MNNRGHIIEEIVNNTTATLLNSGNPTHFNSHSGNYSCIDLSLANSKTAPTLSWEVIEDLHDSDHFPICINILNTPSRSEKLPLYLKWNVKNANWSVFTQEVERLIAEIPQIQCNDNINIIVENYTTAIIKSAESTVKKIKIPKLRNPTPWWNDDCETAIKEKKKAYYIYEAC